MGEKRERRGKREEEEEKEKREGIVVGRVKLEKKNIQKKLKIIKILKNIFKKYL